ncbi:membrane fusion protein (multidrug efflux system) [Filimonas zeae]|uniref:MexE family multidrug efflux RND transporter periplasmic adaptor subunit n=1 Tax=Filimonas zeae TaxID=1737353 RepID=A0A917J267_9BACT|nr:efflux RND transporter periplasmic adaptor subunit [Filimonas zeae]MDR6340695.1 membrane fusion protein (multidrug efflux system) [Filimonas zeae]GGH73936.1 MexE family multidrug efflux RND transporter periplasmic adaptor subunit [Filimonas zeae]
MLFRTIRNYAGVACFLTLASCGNKQQQQQQQGPPPAVPVTVEEAATTSAVYYDEYPGTVTPLNQTELRAQVTGYITGIHFKDGDKVSKGQKLYSIDQQVYDANYQQSLANVAVQEANLVKAQKDADRYHELDKKDAIAKQQVDYADAALESAKKQLAAAKATAESVRANVRFSGIVAPFSGTIGISQVRMGTSVVAGQTVLNTISTDDPMAVDFTVDQKDIYRFSQLQGKGTKDSTFLLAFGDDVYPYPASVSTIDRAVDAQTGTIKTRLVVANPKHVLKGGMNTIVRVKATTGASSVVIPYKAVTEQLGEFFVYVVGDSSKVTQRKVTLGRQIGTSVVIKDGVKEGEKVVTQGSQNLREGSAITTAPPQQAGAPGAAAPAKK